MLPNPKVTELPVDAAKALADSYGLDQIVVFARDYKTNTIHTVSWGRSAQDCGMAAMDCQKLRAVLAAQPTSLEDAVAAAALVRPSDIEGLRRETR